VVDDGETFPAHSSYAAQQAASSLSSVAGED
jgi:hypothetical protein